MLSFLPEYSDTFRKYLCSPILFFKGLKSKTYDFVCSSILNFSTVFSLVSSSLNWSSNIPESSPLLGMEFIKIQELSLLSEYFLVTALFCLTLFFLFSAKSTSGRHSSGVKFEYSNQLVFLLVYILCCYLILVYQQTNLSSLSLTSFNDTIYNDQLSFVSKFIIGFTSILYLMFVHKYVKDQKLNNFEYYIVLLISIFGFFLLCSVNDFITAYLAIELQGLAFYVLASFKKSSNFSVESGVKYFVLGSLSTALFLLGVTLIYGLCGSILFSDFKDFFIWVFSTGSIFFALDSFSTNLEFFQETPSIGGNPESAKLDLIYGKLNLLDKNVSSESGVPCGFAEKLLEFYSENSPNLILSFYDSVKSADLSFLKTDFLVASVNDFLIENSFQSNSVSFLYVLKEQMVSYKDFTDLKSYLLESNFYEDEGLDPFFGFTAVNSVNTSLTGDSYLSNVYDVLNCHYSSECTVTPLNLAEFCAVNSVPEGLGDTFFESNLQANIDSQSYMFSLVHIANIHSLFSVFAVNNCETSPFGFDVSLIVVGVLVVVLALFFKLALAPFHLWSPDVYEGAPSSSTFFFMVLSKFGIFVLLLRICYFSFYSLISYWQFFSLFVASISIFVGAVAGLKQRKLKSLLTYSSINNMGFVLLAFSAGSFEGVQANFYYLVVYMLSSVCIWSIVLNLSLKTSSNVEKQNRDLGDLALLQESNGVLAQGLGITLFSLAGLPPMVGFLAKMGVFKALSGVSLYYVSIINILFSVIATFYYLRIIKIIFFENVLIGHLYETINSKKVFIINLLTFLLVFFFFNPMFLYLSSYKMTLFLNKSFF